MSDFDKEAFVRDAVFEPCEGCGTPVAGPAKFNNGLWGFAEPEVGCVDDHWARRLANYHGPERCQEARQR